MAKVLSSAWESEVREKYVQVAREESRERLLFPESFSNFSYSGFGRFGDLDLEVKDVLKQGPPKQNILVVGVGNRKHSLFQSYDEAERICGTYPFEISGMLESLSRDYEMTVLDVDKENLGLVQRVNSLRVSLPGSPLGLAARAVAGAILRYQTDIQQTFSEGSYMPIPTTFERKRREGAIRFVHGDVVTQDLSGYGPFDFAHCLNVFMHLPLQHRENSEGGLGTKILTLALYNLIRNLKKGGTLFIDTMNSDDTNLNVPSRHLVKDIFKKRGLADVGKVIEWGTKSDYAFVKRL